MGRVILLMSIMFPLMASGQEKGSAHRPTAIGIVIGPDVTYRSLNFSSSAQWVETIRNEEEVANAGFTAGFQMQYRLTERMKLETGLLYVNKSIKTKYEVLSWSTDDPSLPEKSKSVYRYKYLTLPGSVSYGFFNTGNVRVSAKAGVSANIFLARKTRVITISGGDESARASSKQVGYSRFNLSGTVAVGIDYKFSKRIILRGEPFYQRSLTSIVADRDAKEYLYSFGVAAGVYYTLN